MTYKTITADYASGYHIAAGVNELDVAASASVGGAGVVGGVAVYLVANQGRITGAGVALAGSAKVFNGSGSFESAYIDGYGFGVSIHGAGTVTNYGTILNRGPQYTAEGAVELYDGGAVYNGGRADTTALIKGSVGVNINNAAGTVLNYGTIVADTFFSGGVNMYDGGTVTNGGVADTTALISGNSGIIFEVATGVTKNYGTIVSTAAEGGVFFDDGGSLTNGARLDTGALISGGDGVAFYATAGTVTNLGSILAVGPTYGFAVYMAAGGSVTNGSTSDTRARIEGYQDGVLINGGVGTVLNDATIAGDGANGVDLVAGGTVTNGGGTNRTALIQGYVGIDTNGAVATVRNFGTVSGEGGGSSYGVEMLGTGSFQNGSATNSTALIEGYGGVESNTLGENFGTILALGDASGSGVALIGGALVNGAPGHTSALIEGYIGVFSNTASELINFGTIIGEGGTAVEFTTSADDLNVEAGSVFVGSIVGGGGILELGSGTGTLTSLLAGGDVTVSGSMATTTFTDFGTVLIDAGASFTLAGSPTVAAGYSFNIDGAASETGTLTVAGSLTVAGTLSGTGSLNLSGAAAFDAGTDLTIAKVNETAAGAIAGFYATSLTVSDVWTQTAGTVSAGAGDKVAFTGIGDVFSGTLAGAGTIDFTGGSDTLSGARLTGTSVVVNGASVTLSGTVVLADTFSVTSPDLTIAATGATLSGTGSLSLTTTATNEILGGPLTNASRILGAGLISVTSLVNSGTIQASSTDALTVTTGTTTLVNSGLIESTSTGGLTITGALSNTGSVEAVKGTILVDGSVSGAGTVKLDGGTVDLAGAFSGAVDYLAAGGVLVLAHSKTDTVTITGFPKTNIGTIDLQDIAFTGATVSFSGTTTSGTLTIKNGANVATITLEGNYTTSTFTLSADSSGGTIVTDPVKTPVGPPPLQPLVSAIASFGASAGGGGSHPTLHTPDRVAPLLASAA